jgi:ABC-type antimicrobial peptide transport system permease subunit
MTGISLFVMCLILASVVVFGIINTLFMSLYERMFEFGVLRAVGTRAAGVRKLVIFEAGALGIVSIILGVILGFVSTLLFTKTGIDYRGIEFAGTTIKDMLYPEMNVLQFIIYPIGVFIFMLIVGLYPAFVAGRMSIADALRKSL